MSDINQNQDVMNAFLSRMHNILTAPDTANETQSNDSYVSFTKIGIPVTEKFLTFNDLTTKSEVNNQAGFANIVNEVPESRGFFVIKGVKISNVYRQVITQAQVAERELSEREKDMLQKAQDYLQVEAIDKNPFTGEEKKTIQPSPAVISYGKHRVLYINALLAYNNAAIGANEKSATQQDIENFTRNGVILRNNALIAYQTWEGEGSKGYVEQARSILGQYASSGIHERFTKLKADMDLSERQSNLFGPYENTLFFPHDAFVDPSKTPTFTTFKFSESKVDEYKHNDSTNYGGGVNSGFFLFNCSATVNGEKKNMSAEVDTSNFSMSVDLLQLPILRPWFDASIFQSRAWKWTDQISDGKEPRSGMMPVYATSVILAKNLKIKLNMSSEKNKAAFSKIETSTSASYGPFAIKGSYSHEEGDSSFNSKVSDDGIEADGLQIIGFICYKVPLSPNPDPSLDWPDKQPLSA
ncbi:hypothetical protein DLAC_04565 [Tieghemostelium lacteum]|uniref:Uncharacterized protein n=1 Tax=Tieghemostelium lacteum TaxID=361077 RepID=A0A151ZK23_TIELA|nr:hypothetical protein DLAC_04565 [Tieghemostelium lacteum]|eukprot:KYQ94265.1 hypothetical protein DLAC_04565 [Tieghemostelium lacteum]